MPLRLVFLGRLEDAAGMGATALDLPAPATLPEVLARLPAALAAALADPRLRLAVNGALLAADAKPLLADGDELAFLPPVSGG